MNKNSSEFQKLSTEAQKVIQKTEKGLAKHMRLIKKTEGITSIVATIERLKWSLRDQDAETVQKWLKRLDQLTRGFTERAVQRQRTHPKD